MSSRNNLRLPESRTPKAWLLLEDRNKFCRGGLAKTEDYEPVHPRNAQARMWTAVGALIMCYHDPTPPLIKLSTLCWWREEERRYWPMLADWWSAHEDPYIVWATLRKLDL